MPTTQNPADFGVGRLFWVTSEAIVGAELQSGKILLWSPAAERLFGYSSEEALGMDLVGLVPEELQEKHRAGIQRYLRGGEPRLVGAGPVFVPAVTKDGERLDIALTLADVSEGTPRNSVLAVIRDVTEQRRAERDLERANQTMREFVATASHDLRTPLTTILGFATVLSEASDSLDSADRRAQFRALIRAAEQASRLVDDLLTLSQIEIGQVARRAERVDLAAAVREALTQAHSSATSRVAPGLEVWVDPTHLERILVNLLTNAEHYGEPPVTVSAETEDGRVTVRVSDRGKGVPQEFTPRLFSSFARARPATGHGTGLGLSIVRGLARANGGDAFYEKTDEGASFGVQLPAPPAR